MPVNFETPDPGIIERPYVQQIPLEALFKNLAFGQAKYDQNIQAAKRSVDSLRNIKTYGHDTEIKNQLFQNLDQELAKFDGADFRDANVQMQIDSLVDNFTKTREVAGLHARGTVFEQMEREKEAAELKGEEYYNPGYDEALKYYNEGVYKGNARFRNEGNIAPDFQKLRESILKMPQVTYKKTTTDANGNIVTYDVVDEQKAAEAYKETLQNDPKFSKFIKYKFDAQHPDTDWKVEGYKHFQGEFGYYQELAAQENRAAALAKAQGQTDLAAYHLQQAEAADAKRAEHEQILRTADESIGVDFKGLWFDEYMNQQASNFGKTKSLLTASKIDKDPAYLENLRSSNDMREATHKERLAGVTKFNADGSPDWSSWSLDQANTSPSKSGQTEAVAGEWGKWNALNDAFNKAANSATRAEGEATLKAYAELYDPAVKEIMKTHSVRRAYFGNDGNIHVSFNDLGTVKHAPITISPDALKVQLGTSAKYQQGAANKKFDFQEYPEKYTLNKTSSTAPNTGAGAAP